jgi:ketosteroid isomerase-like protein
MSQENVATVKRVIAALNARDVDGYLACCTEDVVLRTPLAEIGGVYEGADGIKRFLVDIEDAVPDFRIDVERVESVGPSQAVAFVRLRSTGRASGISTDAESTNVYDFAAGRIKRTRIFLDRKQALKAVGLAGKP